ncbi:MAG: hypothetical protein Q8S21_06495 [Candidatus Paracaedibacteraceae bacterium]|nr:hypothetical protein [Candidatus Paracaedibacteraceae bacterium]
MTKVLFTLFVVASISSVFAATTEVAAPAAETTVAPAAEATDAAAPAAEGEAAPKAA